MDRKELILGVMSCGNGALFAPVQVQKLFFLLDREIPHYINGPHFNFQPYDYGPFDSNVYHELNALAVTGDVSIEAGNCRQYRLTVTGQQKGIEIFNTLCQEAKAYISEVCSFVLSLNFPDLVSAIYRTYPEMKVNSVFNG